MVERKAPSGQAGTSSRTEEDRTAAGKRVFIIGAGNSAGQAALFFADYASSVTMLVRGEDLKHTMSQYLIDQIALVTGIRVETETQVVSTDGTDCLKAIETRQTRDPVIRRAADALFVMIGAAGIEENRQGTQRSQKASGSVHWMPPRWRW